MRSCTVYDGFWRVCAARRRRQTMIRLQVGGSVAWLSPKKACKLADALATMADEINKEKTDAWAKAMEMAR